MITPDRLDSWRLMARDYRLVAPDLCRAFLNSCEEIERLQAKVTERGGALAKYQQACGDHQRNTFAAREDTQAALAALASVEADRDRARDIAVALEQQLAEIKRLAYIGGQPDSEVRRWIIGVFEDDRHAIEGGEEPC